MFVESIENDSADYLLTLFKSKLSGYLLILPFFLNDLLSCNLSCHLTKNYKGRNILMAIKLAIPSCPCPICKSDILYLKVLELLHATLKLYI